MFLRDGVTMHQQVDGFSVTLHVEMLEIVSAETMFEALWDGWVRCRACRAGRMWTERAGGRGVSRSGGQEGRHMAHLAIAPMVSSIVMHSRFSDPKDSSEMGLASEDLRGAIVWRGRSRPNHYRSPVSVNDRR